MEEKEIFELFEEKGKELCNSKFAKNLSGSGLKIRWEKGKGFSNLRSGPDYEEIKSFVVTVRNFILDSDPISLRNISKIYDKLEDTNPIKIKFIDARKKFNEFLDKQSNIIFNSENLTYRKIIDTYIYGDVIHLNKRDEFKRWISMQTMKDVIFNDIVYVLGNVANFIFYFDSINKEYIKNLT